ncbi:uncharacterized protein ZBIST_1673 [Zygosaccharomyces bailii]|nr:uncharacterized protein ZBIST_1673 [Zygosaccharomyces bailii]
MKLQGLVVGILQEDECHARRSRTLIFALGDTARMHVETQLKPAAGMLSSVTAVIRSRRDVEVLFLNRLQYLFMYLMKLEVETECYNSLVLYGLDELIFDGTGGTLKPEQLHLANLVFNAAFRIKRKHHLKAVTFITIRDSPQLKRLEDYWRHVC